MAVAADDPAMANLRPDSAGKASAAPDMNHSRIGLFIFFPFPKNEQVELRGCARV
jgi:AMMECR1 domain-containing protein